MAGTVIFALTEQQAVVLLKLSSGDVRDFTEPERSAFYALARRGLVRGSPDEGDAHLTHAGMIAALLAAALPLQGSIAAPRAARPGSQRAARARPAPGLEAAVKPVLP